MTEESKDDEILRLRQCLEAVRGYHYAEGDKWGGVQCFACRVPYPCPTVQASRGEMHGPQPDESDRLAGALAENQKAFNELTDDYVRLDDENQRLHFAWKSARRRARTAMSAWKYQREVINRHDEELRKQDEFARVLWDTLKERRKERDRYWSAWRSARRRAKGKQAVVRQAQMWKRAFRGNEKTAFDAYSALLAIVGDTQRIRNLHFPLLDEPGDFGPNICNECSQGYPCNTVTVIDRLHRRPEIRLAAILTGKEPEA